MKLMRITGPVEGGNIQEDAPGDDDERRTPGGSGVISNDGGNDPPHPPGDSAPMDLCHKN